MLSTGGILGNHSKYIINTTNLEGRVLSGCKKRPPIFVLTMGEKKYITLKEAAEMSGYSADYLGQLIRGGKLHGKQVFLNVAWMTTEDAVLDYMKDSKTGSTKQGFIQQFKKQLFSPETLSNMYELVIWVAVVIFGLFALFLVYVFSVSVDHRLEHSYVEKLQQHE